MKKFVVREYKICSPKIKKNLTAVFLADLHSYVYGEQNCKLIQAVDKKKPDLIFCAGDMMIAKKETSDEAALSLMMRLAEKYPVYYGLGNHEYRMKLYRDVYGNRYDRYASQLKRNHVIMLDNERIFNEEWNLNIAGLSIDREYYKRFRKTPMSPDYVKREIGRPDKESFQILIAHNPEYYDIYDSWGADLVLSGHVHGGVVRLPLLGGVVSPRLTLFPKYDGGEFQGKNGKMILSRGLGTHTIPIRVFNPPELIVLRLAKSEDCL